MKITEIFHSHRPHNQNEKDDDDVVQKPYLLRLPDHIIASVSCKIPIKTLMKLRHVCKSLRSLFSDSQFTTDLLSRTRPCHLVSSLRSDRYFLADFNELRRPNGVAALDLSVDSATPSSAVMVGSCKGLVCLYKMHLPYGFFICNPMTGESLSLAHPIREVNCSPELPYWPLSLEEGLVSVNHVEEILEPSFCGFGIGYSSISDVYKIVLIAYSSKMRMGIRPPGEIAYGPREVMVLTVDVSGVWRHIGEFDMNNFDHVHGVYFHDCLHWTGLPVKGPRLIYAFDVESECFRELPLPRWTGSSESQMTRFNLGILNGCLSITVCWSSSIHVWVMKHYGVNDSWTKELDISVDHDLSFGGYAHILSCSPEWQVLLWRGKLLAHTAGSVGFVEVQVDGIPSSVNKAYHHVPSFVSLKDVIRCQTCEFEKENSTKSGSKIKGLLLMEPQSDGAAMENTAVDIGTEACDDESDNFSDIDDLEVDGYLLNEEGECYKMMIWEEMNRENIEEQAAKEEAAKAVTDINCPEGAKKLAQITEAAVAKRKKERQLARAAEAKNSTPAQTAAEAVHQMLTKKRLSSIINFDVLENMFETSEGPDVSKKRKIDSDLDR